MSYIRARRSIKLGPGLKMNFTKHGVGLTAGIPGMHYSFNSTGRVTKTVGIPGTGISWISTHGGGHSGTPTSRHASSQKPTSPVHPLAPLAASLPEPGLLAPKYEKRFHDGIEAYIAGDDAKALGFFLQSSQADTDQRGLADDLFCGLLLAKQHDSKGAIPHLERVVQHEDALPDALMTKYHVTGSMDIEVADHITVHVQLGSEAAAIALAKLYQDVGRDEDAIGILQQLHDEANASELLLCLCELYAAKEEWDEIVEAAAGTTNDDDVTLRIRLFQAEALVHQNMTDAALAVLKDCLRSKKRDPELLRQARYMRGQAYQSQGKSALARKDFAAIYADDPHYKDVASLLGGGDATDSSVARPSGSA